MLEYATCIWLPHTKTDIQKVEQVQRSTAHFVAGDYRRTSSVTAVCVNLIWKSLRTRCCTRDIQQLISQDLSVQPNTALNNSSPKNTLFNSTQHSTTHLPRTLCLTPTQHSTTHLQKPLCSTQHNTQQLIS